jgi:energy-coupling factor transport system ATP-binding protein
MLTFHQVNFSYDSGEGQDSLRDINLTIEKGEVVLLCGESGCGKTTLTRLINGLIPHYYEGALSGLITLNGQDISQWPLYETSEWVGSVFQNPRSQFFNVDTTSELAFAAENRGWPSQQIVERVDQTAKEMHVEHLMDRNLFHLSGGEKQRVACASVAVCDPPVLVLDEPTSNLDAEAIEEMRQWIGHWKRQGKTIVIAEHRLYFLRDWVDKIVFMKEGRIEKLFNRDQFLSLSPSELERLGLRPLALETLSREASEAYGHTEVLDISRLRFRYHKKTDNILEIDQLRAMEGEIVAIIGHNGAGKSTFARSLCGLEKRASGDISIRSERLDSNKRLRRCYMVMQDVNHQLFTESVLDELLLSMGEEDERKAEDILQQLDLLSLKERHPLSLSGGQKQRVAIASAVVSERDIIIFDEPTSGLDLRHMREVAVSLRQLAGMGKTVFVITHDPEFILSCCTRYVKVAHGQLAEDQILDELGAERLLRYFVEIGKGRGA